MRGGRARRIVPSLLIAPRLVLGEVARNGVSMGTGPRWWRLDAAGHVSAARRSLSRWAPSPIGLRPSGLQLRRANRSGLGCFSPDLCADGLEAAPRDLGHRGGVAIDRHTS